MPTPTFSPLTAIHRPGQSLQTVNRLITPLSSPAGLFSVRGKSSVPRATHDIDLVFETAAQQHIFREWFFTQLGALNPFWLPSYQLDMEPIGVVADDATDIDIKECGYTDLLFPLLERRAIIFLNSDGTFLKRDIEDAVNNGDDTETITINEALGQEFIQGRSNGVCHLWYGRLSDDVARIEWYSGENSTVHLQMTEILEPPLAGSASGGPISASIPDLDD